MGQSERSVFDAAPCDECRAQPGDPCARWCSEGGSVGRFGAWDDDPYNDRDYEFDVVCANCGRVYGSLHDGPCPSCGSSAQNFSGADAANWNEHLRRTGAMMGLSVCPDWFRRWNAHPLWTGVRTLPASIAASVGAEPEHTPRRSLRGRA